MGNTTHLIRRFSTYKGDLRRPAAWLASHNCRDVCMESTGKYWIPVFDTLEKTCNVCLTHPRYVKAINGKKPTGKTQNGFPSFSNSIWCVPASFRQRISGNCALCAATTPS